MGRTNKLLISPVTKRTVSGFRSIALSSAFHLHLILLYQQASVTASCPYRTRVVSAQMPRDGASCRLRLLATWRSAVQYTEWGIYSGIIRTPVRHLDLLFRETASLVSFA